MRRGVSKGGREGKRKGFVWGNGTLIRVLKVFVYRLVSFLNDV